MVIVSLRRRCGGISGAVVAARWSAPLTGARRRLGGIWGNRKAGEIEDMRLFLDYRVASISHLSCHVLV
jgi:hypothetical protein